MLAEIDAEMTRVVKERETVPPPDPSTLFTDVYSEIPWHLQEEADEYLREEAGHQKEGQG